MTSTSTLSPPVSTPPETTHGDDAATRHTGPAAWLLLALVHLYQAARFGRPSSCRYLPTCSVYAAEALERHGAVRGLRLTVGRLSRCHPWGGHGADPVPE